MDTIGIVGLGAMGLGIAQVFARAGHPVTVTDTSVESRETAKAWMAKSLQPLIDKGRLSEAERDAAVARVSVTVGFQDFVKAKLVIEAIIEDMDAKTSLFSDLERVVSANAVLATNTSSLSVAGIAEALARPERLVGLHFFNPAPVMKLVELVSHERASLAALERAESLTIGAGKTVVRCGDRPGFIVNRCARPFYGEALAMHEEGRDPAEIDAAMIAAGYRIGPFALIDLVGADVNLAATENVWRASGNHSRYHPFDTLRRQVDSGALGRKSGKGFVTPPNDTVPPPADAERIVLRIEATLANEAATLLDEGGVSADDIDTAMRLGLNFPRGPFQSARAHGYDKVLRVLSELQETAPPHLDGRYEIARSLRDIA